MGFYKQQGVDVILLYPKGKISLLQEKQLTTLGKNIHALSVEGTFDDCQDMVKKAFIDTEINKKLSLISANSINVGRFLPQSFYYLYGFSRLENYSLPLNICVPSGNFGNITSSMIAMKVIQKDATFIASTNANNTVPVYLKTEKYLPKASISTISNAMDVGNPSNFPRMKKVFGDSFEQISASIKGYSFSDEKTKEAMKKMYDTYNYVIDPHTAVGYAALLEGGFLQTETNTFLASTAHPAKFIETVKTTLNKKIELPKELVAVSKKESAFTLISPNYEDLKDILLSFL